MTGHVLVALAVIVLLAGGTLAMSIDLAPHPSVSPAFAQVTDSISVAATKNYGYQPDTIEQVPTAAAITVTFTDDDVLQHSFTISSREGFVIPTSYSPVQLDRLFATYPALFSIYVNQSGDQHTATFESPAVAGWYEFVCNVSGHFQNGMYGFIAFGEDLPSNLTGPSRVGIGGGNLNPAQAASIAALAIALVIGFVVWRRLRSRPPNPSEPARSSSSGPARTEDEPAGGRNRL